MLFSAAVAFCQSNVSPELKIQIVVGKNKFAIGEHVMAKTQLTNTTGKTLCFPKPAQDCQTAAIGWIVITGESKGSSDHEQFICVIDGGGEQGKELDALLRMIGLN